MTDIIANFHFIRPWCLLLAIPAILIGALFTRSRSRSSQWHKLIDPRFAPFLIEGQLKKSRSFTYIVLILLLTLSTIIIAGPTWKKHQTPVAQSNSALVIVWDLSPSMNVEDVKPSRLVRARLKLIDLLKQRKEGLTGLVVYSGEAYVVTPLTDDIKTIISLLPGLNPDIMPITGSNTEMALETARQLLVDSKVPSGDILFLTDGVSYNAVDEIKQLPATPEYDVSFWGIGTDIGGPIPQKSGGFAKNNRGDLVVAKLDENILSELASDLGGIYVPVSTSNNDIDTLNGFKLLAQKTSSRETNRNFDQWVEYGPYLVLALLPFCILSFRRGWVLTAPILGVFFMGSPSLSEANALQDLLLTPDQRGEKALEQGEHEKAAELFRDKSWQGIAKYKSGNLEAASNIFGEGNTDLDAYNLGNTLTHTGRYEDAIAAYNQALELNSELTQAKENREIAKQLLELAQQQQEQEGDSQSNDEQQSDQNQSQDQDSSQNNGDQESQNSNDSDPSESGENSDNSSSSNENNLDKSTNEALDEKYKSAEDNKEQESEQKNESNDELAEQDQQQNNADENEEKQSELQADEKSEENGDQEKNETQLVQMNDQQQLSEEEQALNQWLRKVPDDPSGLLRNKFKHQYQQRLREYRAGNWQPPNAGDDTRW